MKPHKWAKEIKAWADGKEIQRKVGGDGGYFWVDDINPFWETDIYNEYRIKPQPKEPQYLYVYLDNVGNTQFLYGEPRGVTWTFMGKIKLITDNEE